MNGVLIGGGVRGWLGSRMNDRGRWKGREGRFARWNSEWKRWMGEKRWVDLVLEEW